MKIGTKIRQIRRHRHMTQRELGERIGLGESGANRIAQYEISYRTPKRVQINKIAYALDVSEKVLSIEADESLQTLLQHLFWLDQEDSTLIGLIPVNAGNCQLPCKPSDNNHIAIVIHDTAFQELLTSWSTENLSLRTEQLHKATISIGKSKLLCDHLYMPIKGRCGDLVT